MTEVIGIVGAAGDLGRKLTLQASAHFDEVLIYDVSTDYAPATRGVDPALSPEAAKSQPQIMNSLEELLSRATVVHWAAPLSATDQIAGLAPGARLVLHDGVMANSRATAEHLTGQLGLADRISVVHCLMNDKCTVVVATDIGDSEHVMDHLEQLGLTPVLLNQKEHDEIMATSQGLFAVICSELNGSLKALDKRGLLTPSGRRLEIAMDDNESHWTSTTLDSALSNKELAQVLRHILDRVESK